MRRTSCKFSIPSRSKIIIDFLIFKSEPAQAYAYPEYAHLGCYWDTTTSAFEHETTLIDQRNGLDLIAVCQKLAVRSRSEYFALRNGTTCMYGEADKNYLTKWESPSCYSRCGTNQESQGLNCGGSMVNSVYKLGV